MSYIKFVKSLLPGQCSELDLEFFHRSYLQAYLQFLKHDGVINAFLRKDKCNLLADRYLIASVFLYHIKMRVRKNEFNKDTFLIALYIAHDVEEDDIGLKRNLCSWAGLSHQEFYQKRKELLEKLNFDVMIDPEISEKILAMIDTEDHGVWQRERRESHAGALRYRYESTCDICEGDRRCDRLRRYYEIFATFPSDSSSDDDDESFHSCDSCQDSWHSVESSGSQELDSESELDFNSCDSEPQE